jgi:hypothetical protein
MATAMVSTTWQRQPVRVIEPGRIALTKAQRKKAVQSVGTEALVSKSLRQDIARHPNDFVVFATRTAANRFMLDHVADVSRETEPRMIDSGVVGYWRGRTLVVLPIVSSMLDGSSQDKN